MPEIELLAALPQCEREVVRAACTRGTYRKGDYVFHAGEAGETLHMITRGRVAVLAGGPDPVTLKLLGPGESFGEQALIGDGKRTATVRALEATGTLRLGRHDFEALRERHPAVERLLVAVLSEQVRRLTRQVEDLVNVPAEVRIFQQLVLLAEMYERPGQRPVIPLTQGQLASLSAVSSRLISRALGDARKAGMIDTGFRRIEVLDVEALHRAARHKRRAS